MVEQFNQEVQFDPMFYHSLFDPETMLVIVHLVDVCIRWSATGVVKGRREEQLCSGISRVWIAIFGPMQVPVLDEESGM